MSPTAPPWGPPDAQGIRSCRLDDPLRASLKGQRRLRCGTPRPLELDVWPTDERQLLADWLRRADARPLRHDALLRKAGPARASLADRLVQRLLGAGAVEVEETQERGYWKLRSVRFLDPAPLRRQLDLPEPDGVAIALHAGALWTQRGLGWQAWKMSPADLERLPARRPLSERDECLLARLADGPALPAPLDALVGWMRTRREKGEQEALL